MRFFFLYDISFRYPKSVEFMLESSEDLKKWGDAFDRLSTKSFLPDFNL